MAVSIAQFTGDTTYSYGYSGTQQAQTFPVPAGYTRVAYFNLEILRLGTVSGSVTASLYATSGDLPTGSALASASITASTITTSAAGAWYTFDFGDVAVSPGGQYAIVISHGGTSASNTIAWRCSGSDAYGSGRGCYKYSGGSWVAYSSYARDFSFYVYGYGVPTGMGSTTTSSVTNTSMGLSSTVTGDGGSGITSKGFCYSSTTSNPTLSNSYVVVSSGTGAYSTTVSGLSAGTTYYLRSYATNAAGTSYGAVVTQATTYSAPTVTTSAVTSIDKFTATLNGSVTNDNGSTITERGFVYSTTTNPLIGGAGVTKQTVTGTTGTYSYSATSLAAKTTYYVKAYATNAAGTGYGSQTSFETLSAAPSVTSTGVTNLLDTTATFGGNVTAENGAAITERGVVYGISLNPTTGNSKVTTSGTTGAYTCNITGLTAANTYHYRAYAINSYGTSYGADVELRTKPSAPTSFSGTVIGKTQVDLTWTKGVGSSYTIIRRATGAYPTGPGDGVDVYSGVGSTTSSTGLSAGTTYYYRAWALDGASNYSSTTVDLTKTTDYGLTNSAEAYAEDGTYATAPANDNAIYIKLSKDGGATWTNELSGTLPAANGVVSFGSGGTELWGKTWTGDDIDNTSFRLQVTMGSNKTSYQTFKNFGFAITSTYLLTGIEVRVKGYFDTGTAYLDGVSVKCYYGTSILPIKAGAQAYDSTTGNLVYYNGTVWKQVTAT